MKVLIIEDEKLIRNGLIKHVLWKNFGINEVRGAENAEEAYLICQEYIPDIVVSDISMPGESGIELCRKLRKIFPEIEIIFVTGYTDKEYMKAAISLHAVCYVEKPVDREEFAEAVKEAVQRVKRARAQKSAYLHSIFFDPLALPFQVSGKNIFQACILRLGEGKASEIKPKLAENLSSCLKVNEMNVLAEIFDSKRISFLLSGRNRFPDRESVEKEFFQVISQLFCGREKWFLSMGTQVGQIENIADSWQAAVNTEKSLAYMGWNHIVFPEDLRGEHKAELSETDLDKFAEVISQKNKAAALEILDGITRELETKQVFMNGNIRHIYYALNYVLKKAEQTMCLNDRKEAAEKDFFETAETFSEMNQYLKERVSILLEDTESQKNIYVVKKVMDYIWQHYGDSDLTLNILAEQVYLAPPYLSNLFKKSVGLTVGQYILNVRIENAKRLMKEPQLKFYQISSMVGYEDSNYFTKIFKKRTGMTPSEYKESLALK